MFSTRKLKLILIIILGISVFAGAVFGVYKLGQKQAQPFPQPTPTPKVFTTPFPQYRCADYGRNGKEESHCATCGNGICEEYEECTASVCGNKICTADCGKLYCPEDCPQSSRPQQCERLDTYAVYSCPNGSFKVASKVPGGGFTIIDKEGKEILRCPGVAPSYVKEECKNLNCSAENLCELTSTPAITCGPCPQLAPLHPDFCKDGTIILGEKDKCGCQMPPRCEKTSGQKVFCQEPRPEVCTMECVDPPLYICGSDGKFYCNKCSVCANPEVEWYVVQDNPCVKE